MNKLSTRILTALIGASLFLPALTAHAQVAKGHSSLGLSAAYTDSDFIDTLILGGDYAYLFTDSIGLRLGGDYLSLDITDGIDSAELTAYVLGAGADYYFTNDAGDWATYVGASFLYVRAEADSNLLAATLDDDDTGYEARVGAHYFFTERVSLDVRIAYQDISDYDQFTTSLGINVWWR